MGLPETENSCGSDTPIRPIFRKFPNASLAFMFPEFGCRKISRGQDVNCKKKNQNSWGTSRLSPR